MTGRKIRRERRRMTRNECIEAFKVLSQEEQSEVVQEILREYCGQQRHFARLLSLCCGMMKGMCAFSFERPDSARQSV